MNALKISLFQTNPIWENPESNRSKIEELLESIGPTDLIILPEMFTTGFNMNGKSIAEPANGPTLMWMKSVSKAHSFAITGSIVVEENNKCYNRMYFVYPDGRVNYYDKRHLFRLAKENEVYTKGEERVIVSYKSWNICLNICYDLRFPIWSRNQNDYDLLINVASWPITRIEQWDSLLKARAIENLSFVAGVNRVGKDGSGYDYNGHSSVYDFSGKQKLFLELEEQCQTTSISKTELEAYRSKFSFHLDKDDFKIL